MWSIIKFDKKNYISFKNEFIKKLGNDTVFYCPKFNLKILNKLKFYSKEVYLLNDYIFVYNKKFKNISILESLKFTKGLKYFLSGFNYSQIEINNFIKNLSCLIVVLIFPSNNLIFFLFKLMILKI